MYCAVDRKRIQTAEHYQVTVNSVNTTVVMLAFCLDHRDEYLAMRAVIMREGWV